MDNVVFNEEIIKEIFETSTEEELKDYFNKLFLTFSYRKRNNNEVKISEMIEKVVIPLSIKHNYFDLTYIIVLFYSINLVMEDKYKESITFLNKYITLMKENNLLVNEAKLLLPLFTSYLNIDDYKKAKETTTRFEELYGLIEKPDEELRHQYMSMMNY